MESSTEKYSRVCQMILDDGTTWDLSPNDKEALRYILGLVNAMADSLAETTGLPIPTVISNYSRVVEPAQSKFN